MPEKRPVYNGLYKPFRVYYLVPTFTLSSMVIEQGTLSLIEISQPAKEILFDSISTYV